MPTVYVSNWSSHRSPGHHGPRRRLTIMARPRPWERGDGVVRAFVPPTGLLLDAQAGTVTMGFYFAELRRIWTRDLTDHAPGSLLATIRGGAIVAVEDGDTLCCSCSRAEAAARRCHRTLAAQFLATAGWSVVLDGVPFPTPESQ